MADFDSPWKEVLQEYFPQFMAFFFPKAHADIDWSRPPEALDKELQQIVREAELGRRVVDHLVKVWRLNGAEEWVLIHVEIQSQQEADFGQRMYVYNYRLFDRYNRRVASLAVLADESSTWRPDRFGYELWGCSEEFRFPVVKLLDYQDQVSELEASRNPFAAAVLAHLKTQETSRDAEARQYWKLRLAKGLYQRGLSADEVRGLIRFIDWMMELPEELELGFWEEIHRSEQEMQMPFVDIFERKAMEKGIEKGIEKGLAQGRAEGQAEGQAEGLLEGLESLLEVRFGESGLALLLELRAIKDVEVLRKVKQAIVRAATVDDVRRAWA
jgi:hypothetical protein